MIPFHAKPSAGRDQLAQKVSVLPSTMKRLFGGGSTQDLISDFKRREAQGQGPLEMFDATKGDDPHGTGFWRNPAGQLVFELTDQDMRLTPTALANMKNNFTRDWGDQTGMMDLDKLVQHDLLYDYAPDMRKVRADFEQPETGATNVRPGGAFSDQASDRGKGTSQGVIDILGTPGYDPADKDARMSVANLAGHEMQHALQNRFQMPRGGNDKDNFMQSFFAAQMVPQANDIRVKAATERERFVKDWLGSHGDGTQRDLALQQWKESDPVAAAILDQAIQVGGEPGSFARAGMPAVKRKNPLDYFGQYENLAGEQEARAVQDRLSMTTDQRQADPLFLLNQPKRVSPALQTIKWGHNNFATPDMNRGLANTVLRR